MLNFFETEFLLVSEKNCFFCFSIWQVLPKNKYIIKLGYYTLCKTYKCEIQNRRFYYSTAILFHITSFPAIDNIWENRRENDVWSSGALCYRCYRPRLQIFSKNPLTLSVRLSTGDEFAPSTFQYWKMRGNEVFNTNGIQLQLIFTARNGS